MDENTELAKERTSLANERTRLSNERTFLAWTRTGLASVGGGLAIIRFLTFQNASHEVITRTVGILLVALGILIFCLSSLDYKNISERLKCKNGCAGSTWTVYAISVALITASIVLLFVTLIHKI